LELQLDGFEALEPGDDGAELDERFARREGRQWTPGGCVRPRAVMSWSLEVLSSSSSSF